MTHRAIARGAAAIAATWIAASVASAVSPQYWIHDTAEEFLAGKAEQVTIREDGTLVPAPALRTLAEPDVAYLWDVATGSSGT
ncbi:MAG: hypothetical protein KC591_02990, partial [Gemmatimonadetes bacterium]|nr:hypothetical protein [Gemmatimonadota bacterium]